MFASDKMENKNFVSVRNNSMAVLRGIPPGGTKKIVTDEKGRAMTPEWDKVLRSAKPGGVMEIVKPKARAKAKAAKPKVSKSTSRGE